MKRIFAGMCGLVLLASAAFGQSPASQAAFDIADIHISPKSQFQFFQGAVLKGDRYQVKNATLVDLIATAYGIENEKVVGGPSWLEKDRFDVIAKAPANSTPDSLK